MVKNIGQQGFLLFPLGVLGQTTTKQRQQQQTKNKTTTTNTTTKNNYKTQRNKH